MDEHKVSEFLLLKVARTAADMDNCKDILSEHLVQAIHYR